MENTRVPRMVVLFNDWSRMDFVGSVQMDLVMELLSHGRIISIRIYEGNGYMTEFIRRESTETP